jgi:hypothetical protein
MNKILFFLRCLRKVILILKKFQKAIAEIIVKIGNDIGEKSVHRESATGADRNAKQGYRQRFILKMLLQKPLLNYIKKFKI